MTFPTELSGLSITIPYGGLFTNVSSFYLRVGRGTFYGMRCLVLDPVIGVLGRQVKLYQYMPLLSFSLLQLFYLQFHAVLQSKTIRISYNEIVRYLPDLERRVSHVSHYSDPNRICLFAQALLTKPRCYP
jgi:hypothetical protein